MSRSKFPAWLLCGALATLALSCQGQPSGADLRGAAGNPAPASSGASISASPGSAGTSGVGSGPPAATDANPLPVKVISFPAQTPTPAPAATPPPSIVSVTVSTNSLTLNTPRDTNANANSQLQGAGYPTQFQLVGTVHYSDGSYTTDVDWTTSNSKLVMVDKTGLVSTLAPRTTGNVVVTATARASASFLATVPVKVEDLGKVQLDVF